MPLKIGLVTGEYPPMEGGVGAFTRELARELSAQGHTIHVITGRAARPLDAPRPRRFSARHDPIELDYGYLHPRAQRWSWRDVGVVADIALRYDLDVLNIQYQPAAFNMRNPAINFAPWRLNSLCPTVVTFHDLRTPFLFPKAGRLRQWVVQLMARLATGVIATNVADYAQLKNWRTSQQLRCIPIGSNITVHAAAPDEIAGLRAELGVPAGGCLLAYFGFLNQSKGADTLVQALAELDEDTHLVFVGGRTGASDSENNRNFLAHIDGLIATHKLTERVYWTGFLDDPAVSRYLYAADLVVLPYRDGVSLRRGTLMAALAHARPVLSTCPVMPVSELQHGENIWLVPPDDAVALADAIRALTADPAVRQSLAIAAGRVAQHFTWDKIALQTAGFFKELL